MEKLRICMLGGCSLSYGDRTVDDSRQHARKPWLLLEYLVTFRNREIPLEELADLLYPEGGGSGGAGPEPYDWRREEARRRGEAGPG